MLTLNVTEGDHMLNSEIPSVSKANQTINPHRSLKMAHRAPYPRYQNFTTMSTKGRNQTTCVSPINNAQWASSAKNKSALTFLADLDDNKGYYMKTQQCPTPCAISPMASTMLVTDSININSRNLLNAHRVKVKPRSSLGVRKPLKAHHKILRPSTGLSQYIK